MGRCMQSLGRAGQLRHVPFTPARYHDGHIHLRLRDVTNAKPPLLALRTEVSESMLTAHTFRFAGKAFRQSAVPEPSATRLWALILVVMPFSVEAATVSSFLSLPRRSRCMSFS